jgi:GNAT superfamily N-acetyltransferase
LKAPSTPQPRVGVRRVRLRDAKRIAALAGQLGYPSTLVQVKRRIEQIQSDPDHCALVAESDDGQVVGWVHVFISRLLESGPDAEIGGLVVDERHRAGGIGRLLMRQTETWARARGCRTVRLRSNIIRKEAHAFYANLGYNIIKTQHAFAKKLPPGRSTKASARAGS